MTIEEPTGLTSRPSPTSQRETGTMCQHQPPCPTALSADRDAALPVAHHPEQGWSLLCNGVLLFEDTGEILPDGSVIAPHRPTADTVTTAA
ncbi:hypothetical protein GA0115251_128714 [Streptomyces sp. TverLS-915]|nr:hypothetical protein GA0115251_128714 [Streptomyces sp. TverLS-915]SCE56410.1 hypothetical protein GA0115252_166116 [Streptomyces sp. DfronAA-171]